MGRKLAGAALLLLSLFMLLGVARSSASLGSGAGVFAVLIAVVLPAIGGIALWRGALGTGRSKEKMAALRQNTIEAEIFRLAMLHNGRLTAVEVASALALSAEHSKGALDEMVRRELADLDFTDEGVLYYTIHDARYVKGKETPKGLLDA